MARAAIQGMLPAPPQGDPGGTRARGGETKRSIRDARTDEEAMRIDTPPDPMVGHP
jgi:hypothetical protein